VERARPQATPDKSAVQRRDAERYRAVKDHRCDRGFEVSEIHERRSEGARRDALDPICSLYVPLVAAFGQPDRSKIPVDSDDGVLLQVTVSIGTADILR
jgi:hypothetical protein